jgi:hypothetical protein
MLLPGVSHGSRSSATLTGSAMDPRSITSALKSPLTTRQAAA